MEDYRGIMLTTSAYKIYAMVLGREMEEGGECHRIKRGSGREWEQ